MLGYSPIKPNSTLRKSTLEEKEESKRTKPG